MKNNWTAVLLAATSVVIALAALFVSWQGRNRTLDAAEISKIEERVYGKILDEVWQEVKPVYSDFELRSDEAPTTFGEMIRPLVSVERDLSPETERERNR